MSHGFDRTREVILALFSDAVAEAGSLGSRAGLEDLAAGVGGRAILGTAKLQHHLHRPRPRQEFTATAVVGGEELGSGVGRSKKEAEQVAAQEAWRMLDERGA